MKYYVGQKLYARWETVGHDGKPIELKIPVKVTVISESFGGIPGVITVVEDREENAIDFNMDGEFTTSQGEKVVLVERK